MPKHLNQRWEAINQSNSVQQAFNFQLSQPKGQLSVFVQGIWTASVCQSNSVMKTLYSDAGSGIIFNLVGEVTMGNETLPEGVIMLPVKKQAENIVLSPGAQLAGIRFHAASGYGVLGQLFEKPTLLFSQEDKRYNLYQLHSKLQKLKDSASQIKAIHLWAENKLNFTQVVPTSLAKALLNIEQDKTQGLLSENIELSQRQIERLFKLWMGITPKHYQRILRVKKAMSYIRLHKEAKLSDVAQRFGFSDQAHMTREFSTIGCITPKKYEKS